MRERWRAGLIAGGMVLVLLVGAFGFVVAGGTVMGWLRSISSTGWRAIAGLYLFFWLDHKLTALHVIGEQLKRLNQHTDQLASDIHQLRLLAERKRQY